MDTCELSIGMMVPSGNILAEEQVRAMMPPSVRVLSTRLALTGSSDADLKRMTERLDEAAGLLADARVDLIAFNCTAVSTYAPERDGEIARRITSVTSTPAVTTAEAILAALSYLRSRRIALITPYIEAVNEREVAFLRHHGFEVVHAAGYGINLNWDMAQEPPETWLRFALANRRADADAYLLSCTAIRSAEVIEGLEAELGAPVITSNQSLAWHCLRKRGIGSAVAGYGRLLRE